jgi:putative intracellular protease/amidase
MPRILRPVEHAPVGRHVAGAGKHITGFSWAEEVLAGVARQLPYNAEAEMKRRGAHYEKAWLPFIPKVVVDGRIVTGQNPQSAATARKVAALLA